MGRTPHCRRCPALVRLSHTRGTGLGPARLPPASKGTRQARDPSVAPSCGAATCAQGGCFGEPRLPRGPALRASETSRDGRPRDSPMAEGTPDQGQDHRPAHAAPPYDLGPGPLPKPRFPHLSTGKLTVSDLEGPVQLWPCRGPWLTTPSPSHASQRGEWAARSQKGPEPPSPLTPGSPEQSAVPAQPMRASHPECPGKPRPPPQSVLRICCPHRTWAEGLSGAQRAKTPAPSILCGRGLPGTCECSLDWARAPTSPRGPGAAPRPPARELAPDAVVIETGSPHKNGNKKEAPVIMGPSQGGRGPGPGSAPLATPESLPGTQPPPQTGVHEVRGEGRG